MEARYIAVVHKDPDTGFGVSFPHVPGCVGVGATLEEALADAKSALEAHLQALLDLGEQIPRESSFINKTDIEQDGLVEIGFLTVQLPALAKRINITVDAHLLARIDRDAESRGMNRSAYFSEGARRLMDKG